MLLDAEGWMFPGAMANKQLESAVTLPGAEENGMISGLSHDTYSIGI
jgi:hypothetical protein